MTTKTRLFKLYTVEFLVWLGTTALAGSIASLPAYQALLISSTAMVSILIMNIVLTFFRVNSETTDPYKTNQQVFENPDLLHYLVKNFSEEEDYETQIINLESFIALNRAIKSKTDQVRISILKAHPEVRLMDYFDTFDQMLEFAKKHYLFQFNLNNSNIEDNDLKMLAATLPNISYLDVSSNDHLNRQSIEIIIGFKNLRYLNVSRFDLLDEDITRLVSHLRNLKELHLNNNRKVSDKGVEEIGKHLPQLKKLSLRKLYLITDASLNIIGSKLSMLSDLDIRYCNITITGLNSLLQLQQLSWLNISKCSNLYDELFLRSLSQLTSLKTLIFDCMNEGHIDELKYVSHLEQLDMKRYKGSDALFKVIGENFKNLRSFKFSGKINLSDESYVHLMDLKRLKDFYIQNSQEITSQIFKTLGANLNNLRRIDLNYSFVDDEGLQEVSKYPNLSYLNLSRCYKITDLGLKKLNNLVYLRFLSINDCKLITDSGFSFLIKYLKNITELNVSGLPLTDETIISMSSSIKNLTKLKVSGCLKLTSVGLKAIAHFRKLKELDISRGNVDDECLELFSLNLTKMRILDVSWDEYITDIGMGYIASKMSKLNRLIVCMSKKVTHAGISNLTTNLKFLRNKPYVIL